MLGSVVCFACFLLVFGVTTARRFLSHHIFRKHIHFFTRQRDYLRATCNSSVKVLLDLEHVAHNTREIHAVREKRNAEEPEQVEALS